jgi:hypothetical protein
MQPFIDIPLPCSENWESMTPIEKGRFCANCQKVVIDFTQLSNEEIIQTFRQKPKELCVRMYRKQLRDVNNVLLNSYTNRAIFITPAFSIKPTFTQRTKWLQHLKTVGVASLSLALVNCTQVDKSSTENNYVYSQKIEFEKKEPQKHKIENDDILSGDIISRYTIFPNPTDIIKQIEDLDENKLNFKSNLLVKTLPITTKLTQEELIIRYGFYSADMYYAALHKDKNLVINYLKHIEEIENVLGLSSQVKKREVLKKLLETSTNLKDSVLYMVSDNLYHFQHYCDSSKSPHLTGLLSAVTHLEAMYLTSFYYQETKDATLLKLLGEQKLSYESINSELDMHKNYIADTTFLNDYKNIEQQFSSVKVTVCQLPPILKQKGEELIVEDRFETDVVVSDSNMDKIIAIIQTTRNKYVNK